MNREEEKALKGLMFASEKPEMIELKLHAHKLSAAYNRLDEDQTEERKKILKELFAEFGDGSGMLGPIFVHYGRHTKIGKNCWFNFNLVIQDDGPVTIGDNCNIGPNVTIVTPQHSLIADERLHMLDDDGTEQFMVYARPVTIGKSVWIGASVTICPGVTIGDNCVIGAGSVVTKDIPANSVAVGDPCKVVRTITEKDSLKYHPEILGNSRVIE
ncbi:MAG TPA: acetyltransferase [Lachnospiraceae bacterium]|jgi:acetyltransferase-like isoleucine patch superfamily enzyme|nr:acetyltransferase [Lachnospiraceae bacterium]